MSEKKLINYKRKRSLNLKNWIKKCTKLSDEKDLSILLQSVIGEQVEEIEYSIETNTYLINKKFNFLLDETALSQLIVMLYSDHYEVYEYKWYPKSFLELSFEEYSYNKKNIAFFHYSDKNCMTFMIKQNKIEIAIETFKKQIPFYKVVKSYMKIFDTLAYDYEDLEEGTFDRMIKVYRIMLTQIKECVKKFEVRCKTESLTYLNGKLEAIELLTNGGIVKVTSNTIMFQDILTNNDFYTYCRGKVINIISSEEGEERIMSAFKNGLRRFKELQKS